MIRSTENTSLTKHTIMRKKELRATGWAFARLLRRKPAGGNRTIFCWPRVKSNTALNTVSQKRGPISLQGLKTENWCRAFEFAKVLDTYLQSGKTFAGFSWWIFSSLLEFFETGSKDWTFHGFFLPFWSISKNFGILSAKELYMGMVLPFIEDTWSWYSSHLERVQYPTVLALTCQMCFLLNIYFFLDHWVGFCWSHHIAKDGRNEVIPVFPEIINWFLPEGKHLGLDVSLSVVL